MFCILLANLRKQVKIPYNLLGEMQIPICATLSLVIKGSKRDSFRCFEPSAEVVWREFAKVIVRPFVELLPLLGHPFQPSVW